MGLECSDLLVKLCVSERMGGGREKVDEEKGKKEKVKVCVCVRERERGREREKEGVNELEERRRKEKKRGKGLKRWRKGKREERKPMLVLSCR